MFERIFPIPASRTIGTNKNAINAATTEAQSAGEMMEVINIQSKAFSSNRVLDLTDTKVLEGLGLERTILTQSDYTQTQIIGHIAKMNRYDSVISFGSKEKRYGAAEYLEYYKNYIILGGF